MKLFSFFFPFFLAVTQLRSVDAHKGAVKSDRKIKEMEFNSEENKKNLDRMTELVDKLQGKIRTYKKQIEDAEEIAALNLAKFRKGRLILEGILISVRYPINLMTVHKIDHLNFTATFNFFWYGGKIQMLKKLENSHLVNLNEDLTEI